MRELKILALLLVLVGSTYYGIEPYAHSVMHKHPKAADFSFTDLKDFDASLKGDVANGKNLVEANCVACHSVEAGGMPVTEGMNDPKTTVMSYGVATPDLSMAGHIYTKNYLVNFVANPVKAMHLEHKYNDAKPFPMPAFNWMTPQELNDVAAYLASLPEKKVETKGKTAEDVKKAKNKEVFEAACVRCHSMQYAGIKALTPADAAHAHFGSTPPDLSQMIKSRGEHYLHSFINDPQILLHGTAMPRVGLNEEAQNQVIEYMEEVGDSKKAQREALAPWVLGYLVILAIFAILWKQKIWKDLH